MAAWIRVWECALSARQTGSYVICAVICPTLWGTLKKNASDVLLLPGSSFFSTVSNGIKAAPLFVLFYNQHTEQ
jgi:hypothetical protein